MQKISELIAKLQSYQDQYGDVMVTARTQSKVFELAMVDRASVMKPFAVVRLAEITPGTQAWRDYCAISNGDEA